MAFDPSGWLGTARTLDCPSPTPNEAALRGAVGRAYYSAFQVAFQRLKKLGFQPVDTRASKHTWVYERLKNAKFCPIKEDLQSLAKRFDGLKDQRVKADYYLDDSAPFTPGVGLFQAEKAEIWIQEFYALKDTDLKSAIRPG